jgi:hypothetical protein
MLLRLSTLLGEIPTNPNTGSSIQGLYHAVPGDTQKSFVQPSSDAWPGSLDERLVCIAQSLEIVKFLLSSTPIQPLAGFCD